MINSLLIFLITNFHRIDRLEHSSQNTISLIVRKNLPGTRGTLSLRSKGQFWTLLDAKKAERAGQHVCGIVLVRRVDGGQGQARLSGLSCQNFLEVLFSHYMDLSDGSSQQKYHHRTGLAFDSSARTHTYLKNNRLGSCSKNEKAENYQHGVKICLNLQFWAEILLFR